jgi:phosphate uptake regulator
MSDDPLGDAIRAIRADKHPGDYAAYIQKVGREMDAFEERCRPALAEMARILADMMAELNEAEEGSDAN